MKHFDLLGTITTILAIGLGLVMVGMFAGICANERYWKKKFAHRGDAAVMGAENAGTHVVGGAEVGGALLTSSAPESNGGRIICTTCGRSVDEGPEAVQQRQQLIDLLNRYCVQSKSLTEQMIASNRLLLESIKNGQVRQ